MKRFPKIGLIICFLLLIAATCGLVTQSTALAAPIDDIGPYYLAPAQNEESEEPAEDVG